VAFWQAAEVRAAREAQPWPGRFRAVTPVRARHDMLRRSGDAALAVHGFDRTIIHATTGAQRSDTSGITPHRLTVDHDVHVAQAGRGRGKIEHENTNGLKTQGDHREPTFGHGQPDLAAFLLPRNLLPLLCQTVLEWSDQQYALWRRVLTRRQTFCHDIQAFRRSMGFDHWDPRMAFMIRGLELASLVNTS
jgi:hypothetical protein